MSKVILHIGMHKTGTTTLQKSLHRASVEMQLKNFQYLTVKEANHSYITSAAFGSNDNKEYYNYCKSVIRGNNMPIGKWTRDSAREEIRKQINEAQNNNHPLLISAENLCILHPAEVESMKLFFVECGVTDFKIVAYIRDPQSWIVSYAQQVLKEGIEIIDEILDKPSVPRYKEFFEKYINTFGVDNFLFLPFERSKMVNNCILSDFLVKIGLNKREAVEENGLDIKVLNSNESASLETIKLITSVEKIRRKYGLKLPRINRIIRQTNVSGETKFSLTSSALRFAVLEAKEDI